MPILSIYPQSIGTVGVLPRQVLITSNDNYATITAAGYLNTVPNLYTPQVTDVININYSGTFGIFTVAITAGVATMSPYVGEGSIVPPITTGDFAVFANSLGALEDLNYAPSDPAKTKVVMVSGAVTAAHVAVFADTAGTISDGGVLGTAASKTASDDSKSFVASVDGSPTIGHLAIFSDTVGTIEDGGALGTAASKSVTDNTKTTVASVNGSFVVGDLVVASDTVGTIKDAGVSFHAGVVGNGGGSAGFSITVAGITTTAIPICSFRAQTNASTIDTAIAENGSITIGASADPGVCTVNYFYMSNTI